MVASIITIILAFIWLLIESDFMRVRLPVEETIKEYDHRILSDIKLEWEAKETRYQEWLAKRYELIVKICFQRDYDKIDPRDKWMQDEEDSNKRRNGEMIYQRGSLWI